MKILQIINYPAWIKVSKGQQPSQHLFGIDGHIIKYENKGNKYRGYLKDGGYVDFLLFQNKGKIKDLFYCIYIFLKSFKYDLIFDSLCVVTKYLGILFRLYRPCKLVTIIHHPPFNKILKFTRPDACIFFSEEYKKMADEISPQYSNIHYALRWHPDKKWYKNKLAEIGKCKKEYMFIDNGKTFRDHEIMVKAIYKIGAKSVLINKLEAKPQNYIEGKNLEYIILDKPNDEFLLKYLLKSKCILIPAKKDNNLKLLGPIGNTSFMDAIALEMPVICSDNLCFSKDVEKESLGIVYKAGNEESLYYALKKMYEDINFYNECCNNMKKYSKKYDISIYQNSIWDIINKCIKKQY